SGLLKLHVGRPEDALADFTRVVEADPGDTDAAFFLGQCLMQLLRYEEALEWYRKSIAGDPYLRSAYYRAFQALQRLGQRDEALAMMQNFQRLEENPRARLVEFKYTKMGRRGDTVTLDMAKTPTIGKPAGPVFEAAVPLVAAAEEPGWLAAGAPARASITVGDVNDDDGPDLFVAGALEGGAGAVNALFLADADGGYTLDREHPLAGVRAVNAALWGDFDNDGRTDVYLCRRGPNQLWRQVEPGRWQDMTAETQTADGSFDTVDGAFFDADHDGDLDLFLVNADGPNELLNNNRDGTFRPLAAERGLTGNGKPSRSIVLTDFDGDRDVDLILVNEQPPHEVYRNDLLWEYRTAEDWDEFTAANVVAAVAGDVDADGRVELYTLDSEEVVTRWQRGEGEVWKGQALTQPGPDSGQGRLALADVDGDGAVELLVSAGNGWRALSPD
ncbi:MAG: tetratricopeptide repeat protein, partial [bacterium]|nr:tetratricopeptide repeat protein [bacterium]